MAVHAKSSDWVEFKENALKHFDEKSTISYLGFLNDKIICEITAYIKDSAFIGDISDSSGLLNDSMAYLAAFRTNKEFEGKGYFSKLYNFSKELDDILTFISNTMQNKCPVNLSKLQEKNVTLSESMISMINAYNLSLEKELTSEGANIYAKKTKEERDKLREEFIKIQTELAAAISVNEKLVQENKKLQEDNQRLQEENKAYGDRETRIIKILTRENDVNDEQNH